MTVGNTALHKLSTLLYEYPLILVSLDIVAKSILVFSLILAASKMLARNSSHSSSHLLWVSCLLCLALIPLMAITSGIVGTDTFATNSIFVLAVQPEAAPTSAAAPSDTVSLSVIVTLVYVVPFLLLLHRLFASTIAVSGISERANVVRNELETEKVRLAKSKIGLSRSIVLKQSKEITSPFSFGLFFPIVILPASSNTWTETMLEDVLVHEISHIKRFDWITMLVCHVITIIYWFNPLGWFALGRVIEEAENSCDAAVVNHGQTNVGYAENLLRIAKRSRDSHKLLAQMIADKRFLLKRIEHILENNMNHKISKKYVALLIVSVISLLATVGNTRFVAAQAQQSDEELYPISTVIPQYPTNAAAEKIEGWAQVQFTVDSNGNVIENSITVLDAEPPEIFNRSAVRAAAQFKFSPRVRNGSAIDVPNVQYVFRYVLDDSNELNDQGLTRYIYHEVMQGDTLWEIANQYQISVSILTQVNNLDDNQIMTGQILKVPAS